MRWRRIEYHVDWSGTICGRFGCCGDLHLLVHLIIVWRAMLIFVRESKRTLVRRGAAGQALTIFRSAPENTSKGDSPAKDPPHPNNNNKPRHQQDHSKGDRPSAYMTTKISEQRSTQVLSWLPKIRAIDSGGSSIDDIKSVPRLRSSCTETTSYRPLFGSGGIQSYARSSLPAADLLQLVYEAHRCPGKCGRHDLF